MQLDILIISNFPKKSKAILTENAYREYSSASFLKAGSERLIVSSDTQ